jgi:microcin C transport system substrate-binding protein
MIKYYLSLLVLAAYATCANVYASEALPKRHAISEFGSPKYSRNITHWPYVNTAAPKGGKIVLGAFGTFDSLNPFLLKGNWPTSIGHIGDSLMTRSDDELLTLYGLIAKYAVYPEDKSWIEFELRPEAHYDDGVQITAKDFVLSFDTIRKHGRPFLQSFYRDVESAEALSPTRLKFTFKSRNTMKPLMTVASMSPAPSHYWRDNDISKTSLKPRPSSGAYKFTSIEPGRHLVYGRVENYWGADLPVNRGRYNFDEIRYDYYRDMSVMFEAFKAGDIDFRTERSSKRWATGYDIPAVKEGRIKLTTMPDRMPGGIQALIMNTRRAKFADVRVREGLGLLLDFEWMQKKLLFGQYTRTKSYFPNSDYGAIGKPTEAELKILEPYTAQLPEALLTHAFEPSHTDGTGRNRSQLRKALKLFKAAGLKVDSGKLLDPTGQQMRIEILLVSPVMERLMAPYIQTLKKVGVDASMRIVDSSQYEKRTEDFDFDMINVRSNFFPPPGAELRSYYGSAAAKRLGTANWAGIQNPVVDQLIEKIIDAKDLDSLKAHTRALDRVLLWQHYLIPEWHNDIHRLAFHDKFGYPKRLPHYGTGFPDNWWVAKSRQ